MIVTDAALRLREPVVAHSSIATELSIRHKSYRYRTQLAQATAREEDRIFSQLGRQAEGQQKEGRANAMGRTLNNPTRGARDIKTQGSTQSRDHE